MQRPSGDGELLSWIVWTASASVEQGCSRLSRRQICGVLVAIALALGAVDLVLVYDDTCLTGPGFVTLVLALVAVGLLAYAVVLILRPVPAGDGLPLYQWG